MHLARPSIPLINIHSLPLYQKFRIAPTLTLILFYSALLCSALLYSTLLYSTLLYSTLLYSALLHLLYRDKSAQHLLPLDSSASMTSSKGKGRGDWAELMGLAAANHLEDIQPSAHSLSKPTMLVLHLRLLSQAANHVRISLTFLTPALLLPVYPTPTLTLTLALRPEIIWISPRPHCTPRQGDKLDRAETEGQSGRC